MREIQPRLIMDRYVQMCRSAGVDLFAYVDDHNGTFPPDLAAFASAVHESRRASDYTQPDWKSFYYVSGLWTNDPPQMPHIICVSKNDYAPGGVIGFMDGSVAQVSSAAIQRLIGEPWEIRTNDTEWGDHQPLDEKTKENLKKRIKVLPPIGDGLAH